MKYDLTIDDRFWPATNPDWKTLSEEQKEARRSEFISDLMGFLNTGSALEDFPRVSTDASQFVTLTPLPNTPWKDQSLIMPTMGTMAIARERIEQLGKHGHDEAHDDQFTAGELEDAAKALLNEDYEQWPKGWPTHEFLRMSEKGTRERLAVIGAFLAAEIDRIDRQLAAEQGSEKLAQA